LLTLRPLPTRCPFPYTTLFRSHLGGLDGFFGNRNVRLGLQHIAAPQLGGRHRLISLPYRNRTLVCQFPGPVSICLGTSGFGLSRSEEHTSELQSRENLVCRLLL